MVNIKNQKISQKSKNKNLFLKNLRNLLLKKKVMKFKHKL